MQDDKKGTNHTVLTLYVSKKTYETKTEIHVPDMYNGKNKKDHNTAQVPNHFPLPCD